MYAFSNEIETPRYFYCDRVPGSVSEYLKELIYDGGTSFSEIASVVTADYDFFVMFSDGFGTIYGEKIGSNNEMNEFHAPVHVVCTAPQLDKDFLKICCTCLISPRQFLDLENRENNNRLGRKSGGHFIDLAVPTEGNIAKEAQGLITTQFGFISAAYDGNIISHVFPSIPTVTTGTDTLNFAGVLNSSKASKPYHLFQLV